MRLPLTVVAFLLLASVAFGQTNPCTTPLALSQLPLGGSTTQVYVEGAELNANFPDGTPVVQNVVVGVFLKGVDPQVGAPVSSISLPRASMTLVTGTTDCYTNAVSPSTLLALPKGLEHFIGARFSNTAGASSWTAGNSFYLAGAPSAPANTRIR